MKPSLYIAFISVLICFSCDKHVGNDPDAICVTAEATAVKETSANLHGYANLTSDMTGPVELGFLVSLESSPSLDNSERLSTKELNPDHSFQYKVDYLAPGTDYYYRAYVLRNEVYMYGDVKHFKTKGFSASVTTLEAENITADSASLNGSFSIDGEDNLVKTGFFIGKNGNSVEDLRASGKRVDCYESSQRFSAKVSNLTGNSDYYFVAFIDVLGTLIFGSIQHIHTPENIYIAWASNPGFGIAELTSSLDAIVTVSASSKIQDLKLVLDLGPFNTMANQYIKIESNMGKNGSNPVLDLVSDESVIAFLSGLGMSVGASLRSRDTIKLDLKKILDRILIAQPVANDSSFSIEIKVVAQSGSTFSKTAKFHFTAAPDFTWEMNPSFGEILLDPANKKDCKIKVWAPGKIDQLIVKLEDGADPFITKYVKNRTTGGSTTMDLVNDPMVSSSISGFPAPDAISGKDQAILDFGFMYDVVSYMSGKSLNTFTLKAVDKNGKDSAVKVKFRKN